MFTGKTSNLLAVTSDFQVKSTMDVFIAGRDMLKMGRANSFIDTAKEEEQQDSLVQQDCSKLLQEYLRSAINTQEYVYRQHDCPLELDITDSAAVWSLECAFHSYFDLDVHHWGTCQHHVNVSMLEPMRRPRIE